MIGSRRELHRCSLRALLSSALQGYENYASQHADDGDDDEQLDESEAAFHGVNCIIISKP